MTSFERLLAGFDSRPDRRGSEFERLCQWLLRTAPEYRVQLRHVWLWDEWPGRWAADAGIDLVAETVTGELWAIQAKAYDPAYAIKKADVDSFLSESARPEFQYRLLIATTDRIGQTARRTLAGQEKPAGVLLRSQLALAEVVWPASPADLRLRPQRRKRPLSHQRKALAAVARGFRSTDRGQLVMACGTGKTLAACFLAERLEARRVLVLVPSLSLLAQSLREWGLAAEFGYLAVCSDATVTRDETDAVVASTSELGFPVTTDPAVIARFLRGRGHGMRVVFATYQSSPRIAEAQESRTLAFDLVIADEAHRCAGLQAGIFATVLDEQRIRSHKRLFMTATPRYYTGRLRKEASEVDWEIASMDDETQFGPVLHRLSFAQAIEQNLLSDYQVVVVGVTDQSFREMAARGTFVTTDGETVTDARTLARQIGLLRAMRNHDLHRIVSFHSRISSARRFAASILEVTDWMPHDLAPGGTLWAEHVSGEMSSGERDVRLNRLRAVADGERGLLTNARCLSEGVDVPSLDGVAFIDPRRSQVDVVQAVGRAMRKAEKKILGTIVIPVFVDEDADPEETLEASEFDRVWQIVRALRDHDEDLADELDQWRRELGRRGSLGKKPAKILLELPSGISADFARAFDTRLVETTTRRWEFWYGLLERFVAREGHARVPGPHVEEGYNLGTWVFNQRRRYSIGSLSSERAERLRSLPGWVWSERGTQWDEGFSVLESFVARVGHADVPRGHVEDGFQLSRWVREQRGAWRRQWDRLSADRRARLEALPGWVWNTNIDWDDAFSFLQRFVAREGHARVPWRHVEAGYTLGVWVRNQRSSYRSGRLSGAQANRLESLPGWAWNTDDADWEDACSLLERFVAREGHARVLQPHSEDGFALGAWVNRQRLAYRAGRLSGERVARLDSLPRWAWNASDARWEDGFSLLERFVARERHARVPPRHAEDGYPLGGWAQEQRAAYRSSRLAGKRIARLEALPGWVWDTRKRRDADWEAAWEKGFFCLERFAAREGHARVPWKHIEDDYSLGVWVLAQRAAYRSGRLSGERAARLQSLPRWAWNTWEAAWEKGFFCLERFAAREGQARVPQRHVEDGFRLGQWVGVQRRAYRAGRLSEDRTERLDAVPGWTWERERNVGAPRAGASDDSR